MQSNRKTSLFEISQINIDTKQMVMGATPTRHVYVLQEKSSLHYTEVIERLFECAIQGGAFCDRTSCFVLCG